jgi:hypothetical protein
MNGERGLLFLRVERVGMAAIILRLSSNRNSLMPKPHLIAEFSLAGDAVPCTASFLESKLSRLKILP